tara:strand:- start:1968 stop:2426 length:459 start_codon:yes stop_codon:yes gene_type:complete
MIESEVLVESKNWKKIIKNPSRLISNLLKKFPDEYKFNKKKVQITVLLTSNKRIKFLNKKFRKKNKSTDILSFPFFEKKNLKKVIKLKKFYLGDIVISYEDFIKKNKSDYEISFIKIFIHGFLHLLKFDHISDNDYLIMNKVENQIFKKIKG